MKNFVFLMLTVVFLASSSSSWADRTITLVNHEFEGTKQWLPGTIAAYVGETITINLINNTPSGVHGFHIPDFNQRVDIKKGEKKSISFVANKVGIFDMKCHLHPAHVGGQLIIMEKTSATTEKK